MNVIYMNVYACMYVSRGTAGKQWRFPRHFQYWSNLLTGHHEKITHWATATLDARGGGAVPSTVGAVLQASALSAHLQWVQSWKPQQRVPRFAVAHGIKSLAKLLWACCILSVTAARTSQWCNPALPAAVRPSCPASLTSWQTAAGRPHWAEGAGTFWFL